MDLYEINDYKLALRSRLKELRVRRPGLTFKRVASRVPIQYTYFSRVLNAKHLHFSEDHLFSICQILEFDPAETELIMLMRDQMTTANPARRQMLLGRIERERRERWSQLQAQELPSRRLDHEISYLLDPYATVVFTALHLRRVRENPRLLSSFLGISLNQVKAILALLASMELIELDETGWEVRKLLKSKLHFGKDHPIMRVHQGLFRMLIQPQLMRTEEEEKTSFQATFTTDDAGFEEIKKEFQVFLRKVERIASTSRTLGLYQVSFDAFKWL